jgi:hypothetical protein
MNSVIETNIIEYLHRLDERHKAEVLDFVEYLSNKKSKAVGEVNLMEIDPARDLTKFIGVHPIIAEDGVAYQRRIRDAEWS